MFTRAAVTKSTTHALLRPPFRKSFTDRHVPVEKSIDFPRHRVPRCTEHLNNSLYLQTFVNAQERGVCRPSDVIWCGGVRVKGQRVRPQR